MEHLSNITLTNGEKNLFAEIFFTLNFRNASPTRDVPVHQHIHTLLANMATEITRAYKDRVICKWSNLCI